jgi:hypothetical protein
VSGGRPPAVLPAAALKLIAHYSLLLHVFIACLYLSDRRSHCCLQVQPCRAYPYYIQQQMDAEMCDVDADLAELLGDDEVINWML